MTFLLAHVCVNTCNAPKIPESRKACAFVSLLGTDLLLTITSLVVGILGLTAVLNLPVAASGTFVAIGIAIPVIYAALFIIECCN